MSVMCHACGATASDDDAVCSECSAIVWTTLESPGIDSRRVRRRSRRVVVAAAASVVVAAAIGVAIAMRSHDEAPAAVGSRMVPQVSMVNGRAEFAISLPAGQHYIVSTPAELDIASLGATTYVSIGWDGQPDPGTRTCCDRVVRLRYSSPNELFPGVEPASIISSSARVFDRGASASGGLDPHSDGWIVFDVDRWTAVIDVSVESQGFASISRADQQLLARRFDAEAGSDGFPVLQFQSPLVMREATAGINFGLLGDDGGPRLLLSPFYCGQPGSNTAERRYSEQSGIRSVTWCEPETHLFVMASGPDPFVDAVAGGLETRPA